MPHEKDSLPPNSYVEEICIHYRSHGIRPLCTSLNWTGLICFNHQRKIFQYLIVD